MASGNQNIIALVVPDMEAVVGGRKAPGTLFGIGRKGNGTVDLDHTGGTVGKLVNVDVAQQIAAFPKFILPDVSAKPAAQDVFAEQRFFVPAVKIHIFHSIFDSICQFPKLDRLEQVVVNSQTKSGSGIFKFPVSREKDAVCIRALLSDRFQQL